MAVLDTSRPRRPRLARQVSAPVMFVGVLLLLTNLFTIDGFAQVPSAVQNLTATTIGDGQVTLSWDAPSTGAPLTSYQYAYTSSVDNQGFLNHDLSRTRTITGLTNGVVYTLRIRAINSNGPGTSASTTATPNIAAPTGLTATAGDGQVTLSWTAPSVSTITGYQYQKDSDAWASAGTSSPYTVTGLTNDTAYTFKVRAVGAGGGGTASASASATPRPSPPAAPTNLTAVVGNGAVRLNWTAPAGPITRYEYTQDGGGTWTSTGSTNATHTITNLTNGTTYTFQVRAVNTGGNGAVSTSVTARPQLPNPPDAPTGLRATPGDGQVRLSWTAPTIFVTHYEYRQDDGAWTSTGSSNTTHTITNLTNGTAYTFRVRGVNSAGNGAVSSGTATPLRDAPRDPVNLQVEMVPNEDKKTANAILTWNPPSNAGNTEGETLGYEYRYQSNPWTPWTSTGSSETTHTVTGLQIGTEYTFQIRAFYVRAGGNSDYIYTSSPSTSSTSEAITLQRATSRIFECPIGWTRGSVFGKTKKALIYELKVDIDRTNRVSIYQLKSLAIYVHPDEGLETLDGWTLKVGTLYNNFGQEFKLTAENSVIDKQDFAHIQNPQGMPIPLGTLGFIGQSLPSFDYRLYDAQGIRVDFGISCYKEGGLTWRLWNTKDPRVIRVLPLVENEEGLKGMMRNLNWDSLFFRTQWTAAIMPDLPDAPAAPSQVKKNVVGTWADLKKQ